MKVLKFGGTSVGSVESIKKVISVVDEASQNDRIAVIVSAFGGVTDQLLEAGKLAAAKDQTYLTIFETVNLRHFRCGESAKYCRREYGSIISVFRSVKGTS